MWKDAVCPITLATATHMACTPSASISYRTRLPPPTSSAYHRPFHQKIAAYRTRCFHRVWSVDLEFKSAPEDLMKKFVDTLLRLPNLRRLDLLSVSHRTRVTAALKPKRAIFPNIREMVVEDTYPDFIKSCPNLESLTFRQGFVDPAFRAIELYGAGLKRVTGVDIVWGYPSILGELMARHPRDSLTRSRRPYQNCNTVLPEASGDRACR